jgi:epoxyqueuosine reductase
MAATNDDLGMGTEFAQAIKDEALRLGFSACGFAKAEPVADEVAQLVDHWVDMGYHADMQYMERNRHLRLDPTQLVPGCRTLIVVALNYYPKQPLPQEAYQIAYYAYGKDYHRVVKDKLHQLFAHIKNLVPEAEGRAFCDTAPLLERYWAVRAGLGFIGRNRQLIIPGKGSYFFLGVLAVNVDLAPSLTALPSNVVSCGDCKRCLIACPTKALTLEGIDCRRCLSYLTIENRGEIPDEMAKKLGHRIYGCDTCQRACPHNRYGLPTEEESFGMSPEMAAMTPKDWQNLTPERYKELFKHSAMERAGYEGLMRNLKARDSQD